MSILSKHQYFYGKCMTIYVQYFTRLNHLIEDIFHTKQTNCFKTPVCTIFVQFCLGVTMLKRVLTDPEFNYFPGNQLDCDLYSEESPYIPHDEKPCEHSHQACQEACEECLCQILWQYIGIVQALCPNHSLFVAYLKFSDHLSCLILQFLLQDAPIAFCVLPDSRDHKSCGLGYRVIVPGVAPACPHQWGW